MKALVYDKNVEGSIKFCEREIPEIKNPKDAIVKVTLSTICTSDLHIKNGFVPKANNNVILGHEFVGEVVAVGPEVNKFYRFSNDLCR